MKCATAITSLLLLCSCTGCLSVCNNAYRTLIKEPKQFSWRRDRCESRTLYSSWAADAWAEQRANGAPCSSADFALGFQEGFVEYCYAGGSGEPPPVPPRPYWNSLNRVAPLNQGAEEWFSGYRLGSRVAREGGYRDQAVAPASASLCSRDDQPCSAPGCLSPAPSQEYEIHELVPTPHSMPEGPSLQSGLTQPLLYEPPQAPESAASTTALLTEPIGARVNSHAAVRHAHVADPVRDASSVGQEPPEAHAIKHAPVADVEPLSTRSMQQRFGNEYLR